MAWTVLVWSNAAIRTFEKFAIQGQNGGISTGTVNDLKCIRKEYLKVLVDDIVNADASKRIFA